MALIEEVVLSPIPERRNGDARKCQSNFWDDNAARRNNSQAEFYFLVKTQYNSFHYESIYFFGDIKRVFKSRINAELNIIANLLLSFVFNVPHIILMYFCLKFVQHKLKGVRPNISAVL